MPILAAVRSPSARARDPDDRRSAACLSPSSDPAMRIRVRVSRAYGRAHEGISTGVAAAGSAALRHGRRALADQPTPRESSTPQVSTAPGGLGIARAQHQLPLPSAAHRAARTDPPLPPATGARPETARDASGVPRRSFVDHDCLVLETNVLAGSGQRSTHHARFRSRSHRELLPRLRSAVVSFTRLS